MDTHRGTATSVSPNDSIVNAVRAQLVAAFPRAAISSISNIPTADQHPLRRVALSDGKTLLLSGPAVPGLQGIAVSTYSTTHAEAIVLGWLTSLRPKASGLQLMTDARNNAEQSLTSATSNDDVFTVHLPQLVQYFELEDGPLFLSIEGISQRRLACTLTIPTEGQTVATLEQPLNNEERRSVDRQKGQLLRMFADIHSPNGHFGFAAEVLAKQPIHHPGYKSNIGGQRPQGKFGHQTWSDAYERLMQEVGHDASSKTLNIPFSRLRVQFDRFRAILDNVTTPQMVALGGMEDANTLVVRQKARVDTKSFNFCTWRDGDHPHVRVTGLRDWSNFLFGDPLIAGTFCSEPNADMVGGFAGKTEVGSGLADLPPGLFDDQRHVPIRLLLYRCYWAVKDIVQVPTVPRAEGTQGDVLSPAWTVLHEALRELEASPSPADGPLCDLISIHPA